MHSLCIKINNTNILNDLYFAISNSNILGLKLKKNKFKIYHNIIIHFNKNNQNDFFNFLAQNLCRIIITYFEPKLIKRFVNLNYFYFNDEDKKIILDEYKLIKDKDIYDEVYVNNIIQNEVIKYITVNKTLILTGFVNFRINNYLNYLEKIASESVNQYIIDKEYISFVNLLRNYVESKLQSSINVNLIYINSNGILISDDGKYIELDRFNSSYISDISFSQNDYILNTLVGLLPSKIKIHLISEKDQFIKTIEMIFTNRVHICNGCSICKTYKLL